MVASRAREESSKQPSALRGNPNPSCRQSGNAYSSIRLHIFLNKR